MRDSLSQARLVLNAGLDQHDCHDDVFLDERGMRFVSQWRFSLGTTLAVRCRYLHSRVGWAEVALEGTVVWSERCPDKADSLPTYDTTVLFLELPDDLRQDVREFSYHLAAI